MAFSTTSQDPRVQARALLSCYFSVCRSALAGDEVHSVARMEACGWDLERHAVLVRRLAEGCHNLAELALGEWGGDRTAESETVRRGLVQECRWLYKVAETLEYPATWQMGFEWHVWQEFWDQVASILQEPPRYGVSFHGVHTTEDIRTQVFREAMDFGLVHRLSGWRAMLAGLTGRYIIERPEA